MTLSREPPATLMSSGTFRPLSRSPLYTPCAACDDTGSSWLYPGLTTTREFPEQLGQQMVKLVLSRIAQPSLAPRVVTIPDTGRGYLDSSPVRSHISLSPEDRALKDFMALITNPQWDSLGGPCRRCGNYYLKKTKWQNVYCSRVCSSGETAVSATRKWREREQQKKIGIARKAIAEWGKAKRRMGWKEWVSNDTGYTVRWISRAVTEGAIQFHSKAATSRNTH